MRYIALLRGINVGGNTMIKMAELKTVFEKCGFKNVTTYINSGNLAFDVAKKPAVQKPARSKAESGSTVESALISKLETAIEKEFGKQIPVMVREQAAITDIIAKNPFEGQFETHKEMHVLFMK